MIDSRMIHSAPTNANETPYFLLGGDYTSDLYFGRNHIGCGDVLLVAGLTCSGGFCLHLPGSIRWFAQND